MLIIGCDYHPSVQQIAWADTETGECGEKRLMHSDGEAERFYRELKQKGVQVRVGIEATGHRSGRPEDCDSRAAKSYEVAVDAQGKFEISVILGGRYTITLESDENAHITPPHLPTTFDLADKACARFSFWIDPFANTDSDK